MEAFSQMKFHLSRTAWFPAQWDQRFSLWRKETEVQVYGIVVQAVLWVQSHPALLSKFPDSQECYTEKPGLKNPKKKRKKAMWLSVKAEGGERKGGVWGREKHPWETSELKGR